MSSGAGKWEDGRRGRDRRKERDRDRETDRDTQRETETGKEGCRKCGRMAVGRGGQRRADEGDKMGWIKKEGRTKDTVHSELAGYSL